MMKAFDLPVSEAKSKDWFDFQFELKYDGTRSFWLGDKKKFVSERNIDITDKFSHIVEKLKVVEAVLDGEMIVSENSNVFDITRKDNWTKGVYVVFDILNFYGTDCRSMSLQDRQGLIKELVSRLNCDFIQVPKKWDSFKEAWAYVEKNSLEGLMAKNIYSKYADNGCFIKGTRSRDWLKIKNKKEDVVVFDGCEVSEKNADYITLTNKEGDRVACCSDLRVLATEQLAKNGKVVGEVEYLYLTESGKHFQPVLKRVV
jgi:ATP-dependent DNA ligase